MSKIIALAIASIVGFYNSLFLVPQASNISPIPIATVSASPAPKPSPTALITQIKAPNPSEKALRIASYAIVRMSDANKQGIKKKYGNENMSDTDIIRAWAFAMDKDSALMARNEAVMEQQSTPRQVVPNNYVEPAQIQTQNISGSIDSDYRLQKIENCQKETQTYNECVQGYNEKVANYSQCLAEASDPTSDRAVGFGRYASLSCSKPFNSCMKPISCY